MSLNGLDNPAVIDAYQTALTEAGGWLLLQYVSRDEVALLDRGTGGVPDVRNTIDGYEEKSPLYGFLQYRRRKVVLSYLPEGLSRLVQARTTVQFQSVLDKFSPHDTVFSLSQPSSLTESALSSACLLHTASGSITSSSSSLRRRRLMEIAEDAEESPGSKDVSQIQSPSSDMRQRSFSQLSEATIVPPPVASDPPALVGDEPPPAAKGPEEIQTRDRNPSISTDYEPEPTTPQISFQEELPHSSSESRKSSQSARPSLRDLERASAYSPKVKRGPRPSVDGSGRPRTAGNLSRSIEQQRPVASLPAGVRSSSLRKSNTSAPRPRSQGSTVASKPSKAAPPMPPLLVPPLSMPVSRPPLSPGAKSLSALSSSNTSNEKERLMKALQLRKSQMEKKAQGGNGNNSKPKAVQAVKEPTVGENKDKGNDEAREKGEEQKETNLELDKTSVPEIPPSIAPEALEPIEQNQKEEDHASKEPSKPESIDGMGLSDSHGDSPSDTLPLGTATELSTDRNKCSETDGSHAAQTLPEPETDASKGDLAVLIDTKTKSGPVSPSAAIDVPLEDKSLKASEEIVSPSPPTEKPLSLIPGGQEVEATGESSGSIIQPQSIPLTTNSPPPSSRPSSILGSPAVITLDATEPQHDLTPEIISSVEQKEIDNRKEKRKPFLEPIQVPTPDYSDDDNLSDDSFMEELKSATVEEAKPISVGKSPLSPGYSNNGNDKAGPDAWRNSRAVSNPSAVGHQPPNMHAISGGRSVSTPFTEVDTPGGPVLVAKKINVSSGISKRIQALEKLSTNRESPPNSSPNLAASSASSFETLRKRASVSLADRPVSRHGSFTPEAFSRASSVRRPESQSGPGVKRAASSVSVTARILREPTVAQNDSNSTSPEPGVLNLQASPLTVEHKTSDASLSQSLTAESTASKSEKRSMSTSSASSGHQSPSPSIPPRSESRLSVSSASRNESAILSKSDVPSSPEEKKESRTSRLLRRMSSITSNSRKSSVSAQSPVVKEEESSQPHATGPESAMEVAQAIDIGEVNVQFPDTLLWKRRFIRIDDQGYLVLTPGNIDSSNRNMIKRYHLTEFRTPCLPDEDCQELPNSILLDFLDGRTLQCACESRQGQAFVLQTLVNAHGTHQQPSS